MIPQAELPWGSLIDDNLPATIVGEAAAIHRTRGPFVEQVAGKTRRIEADVPFGIGHVQLVHSSWTEPIDVVGIPREHHLELALLSLPAGARGCFPDCWGPHRFERIGELFLLPAEQAVRTKSLCRRQQSIVCNFSPQAVSSWFEDELEWTAARLRASLDIESPIIRSLLFRLGEEVRNPGFAGAAMIEMMAGQIVIELARYYRGVEQSRAAGGLSADKLRLIDERLAEQSAPPSLGELAALCGFSVRHLTRAFRISRQCSIGSYICEWRINQAKRLLASGTCIKSAAFSMGFTSPSNFSSTFRRVTGETPNQYRQRARRRIATH
jgi:AraC family transcriptional regulator